MYRDFFGFTGRPFQLTPDPACYFESLSHRRALSCLGYSVAQGEGFIVITGDVGAGKSTLVRQFLATIDRAVQTTVAVVCGQPESDAIIPLIARAIGKPAEQAACADPDAIERLLQDEAQAGRRCLLVMDDAHNLSVAALAALRPLAAVQFDGQPMLQCLLVGRPGLRNRLKSHPDLEPLRLQVIASLQLDPLEAGEVEGYIMHRFACVGWSGRPSFAPRVFVEIHAATGGMPARVNQIANRLLLLAAVEQQEHIDGAMLAQVLEEVRGGEIIAPASPAQTAQYQDNAALLERLSSLESRVIEQERTIRHAMSILIEWIERDEAKSVAA